MHSEQNIIKYHKLLNKNHLKTDLAIFNDFLEE